MGASYQLVAMASDAPLVRISRALILYPMSVTYTYEVAMNLLRRIQPRHTQYTHPEASKEDEEERHGYNTKLI
jgi:hypothetical protein